MKVLALVPPEQRIGPLIIDENAGRPYAKDGYTREWRIIANLAGIPTNVWNMDARAGGISEADEAGAELDEIRSTAAHAQTSTTIRYIRGTIGKIAERCNQTGSSSQGEERVINNDGERGRERGEHEFNGRAV